MSCVRCQVSGFRFQVSGVRRQVSGVTCHLPVVTNANSQSHGPSPCLLPTMHCRMLLLIVTCIHTNLGISNKKRIENTCNFFLVQNLKICVPVILLFVHGNSNVHSCKFQCASIQIPSCVHENYVVSPCKFRCASLQMRGKDQKYFFCTANFNYFWAKIAKSETNVQCELFPQKNNMPFFPRNTKNTNKRTF